MQTKKEAQLFELFTEWGVWVVSREKRLAYVQQVIDAGIPIEDVELLYESVQVAKPESPEEWPSLLLHRLEAPEVLGIIEDARRYLEHYRERTAKPGEHDHGEQQRDRDMERLSGWQEGDGDAQLLNGQTRAEAIREDIKQRQAAQARAFWTLLLAREKRPHELCAEFKIPDSTLMRRVREAGLAEGFSPETVEMVIKNVWAGKRGPTATQEQIGKVIRELAKGKPPGME